MNVTEELRKRHRQACRQAGTREIGEQLGKRARRVVAKAKERQRRPFTMKEVVQAAIINSRRSRGPNAAQQFYQDLLAGKLVAT